MATKATTSNRSFQPNKWLRRYAALVACATFLLIIAGALVTSNDAGLSVPDWPTSFGTFRMPRMVGGVKFEHGHRMIAGTVAILTILLAIWLWRSEPRAWVRKLGVVAVLAIIAQAVLGGITVLFFLPVAISVSHACLGQLFFCITISLALFTRFDWRSDEQRFQDSGSPSLRQLTAGTTIAIFLQLMLGAAFRHNGFGITPHVIGAVLVTVGVLWTLVRILVRYPREPRLVRPAALLSGLLLIQVVLGVSSYIVKMAAINAPQPLPAVVEVTTTHVAVGALVLASSLVLTLQIFRDVASGKSVAVALARSSSEELPGPSQA
jgi:cytochrome c oxidase assembly protein subunit 15